MIDPDSLNVWCEDKLIGYLWRNAVGYIGFRYDSDWITQSGFSLSQTLPLQTNSFSEENGIAHRFFANLLPEGNARDRIVRDRKLANTDFELLRAIGGECAGALSILSDQLVPSLEYNYQLLSDEALSALVIRRGQIITTTSEQEYPRLSLAGAQEKCPILIKDGQYHLPLNESPTSHILKFEFLDYTNVPAYETYTTLLAEHIGLPTVDIDLCENSGHHYIEIERYDRICNEVSSIERLHQEDLCQALGYGHDKKYQEAGGPNFAQCFELVQRVSTDPVTDSENLLRWQIFNVLVGNSDGHAKNLSLVNTSEGIRLAPFYDLICTRAIERIDTNLAFSVGGERNPGNITQEQWNGLAKDCDVSAKYLNKLVQESGENLLDSLSIVRNLFEIEYGEYAALQRIDQIVTQQCKRI